MHVKSISCKMIGLIIFIVTVSSCTNNPPETRNTITLNGVWQFRLDEKNTGIQEKWYTQTLHDSIILSGTLDENQKGFLNTDTTDYHLNRLYHYTGPAWFQKIIEIPDLWAFKNVELIMERTKVSHVWFDSLDLGTNNNLYSKQVYDLTGKVSPGKHALTIMINNDPALVPVAGSHAYSEDTQTNWNGIIGRFCLEASNPIRIAKAKVTPDIHAKQAKVQVTIKNPDVSAKELILKLKADTWNSDVHHSVSEQTYKLNISSTDTILALTYDIGEKMQLWSEFNPALYKLQITLEDGNYMLDNLDIDFGMREFGTRGTQFSINGKTTFLRGKHDACVFPLTGYPPMDVDGWLRVYRIARDWGINHYRFHSWTPSEAAFLAADICGIYLQPELPIWWSFKSDDSSQVAFMMKEGYHILDNYANHASFVMFALGNEISQDRNALKQMVAGLRNYDARPLFAQGSNNRLWDPSYAEGDDFWVTFRTGREKPDCSTDVRTSISFLDAAEAGILNTLYPVTTRTFSEAIKKSPVPVVGFEVGQYQVYPNFEAELPQYTGVLKPWNLEQFHQHLTEKGMADQAMDFFKASGALSVLCYREDIETAIRTPGFGGFHLLDLQDYPGQGTALVGMLDAFMDNKGLIKPAEFRQFCDEMVVLLLMEKYCWENSEIFNAAVQVANYSASELRNKSIQWKMIATNGAVIQSGSLSSDAIPQGRITNIGQIEIELSKIQEATQARILLEMAGTPVKKSYPVWIYPADLQINVPPEIDVATQFNPDVIEALVNGDRVLLFPDTRSIKNKTVGGQFIAEFWNYRMFSELAERFDRQKSHGTMGLLTNPEHPIFNDFPTDFHTNWQWWSIVKNSRPLILNETAADYRPVIQVIDNINRNHKLGLVFEFKVGKGKLLVCMANLPAITDKPEARQLYASILNYMKSENFDPNTTISTAQLEMLLK